MAYADPLSRFDLSGAKDWEDLVGRHLGNGRRPPAIATQIIALSIAIHAEALAWPTLKQIATRLDCTQASVSVQVKALLKAGLLVRRTVIMVLPPRIVPERVIFVEPGPTLFPEEAHLT